MNATTSRVVAAGAEGDVRAGARRGNASSGQPESAAPGTIGIVASTRAELLRLRGWPALWTITGVWLLLNLIFAYTFPYVAYLTGDSGFSNEGAAPDSLLADVLPAGVPAAVVQGMPLFGGALMLVLGALAAGSGYAWGTWKTAFLQGPSRLAAFGGTVLALLVVVVGTVLATVAVDLGVSAVLATVEQQPLDLPSLGALAEAAAAGTLIFAMWTLAGVFLGTLARGPALAVGLGVVWVLAVENLLRGVAGLVSWLDPITDVLPGTAAGSLAGTIGAGPEGGGEGTPGVLAVLDAPSASLLLGAYAVVFAGVAAMLVRRRDLA